MAESSKYSDYPEEKKERLRQYAKDYYQRNRGKQKARHQEWLDANKDYVREYQRQSMRDRKAKAIEYLGGRCMRCLQEFHPAVYELHHRNPEDKDRDPSKMMNLSWARLEAELNKCDLLCANCHRLVHNEERY